MKKRIYFFFILLFTLLLVPQALAHELYDDGWHAVVKNDESEREKTWENQTKEWAFYKDGVEVMRYSKLSGAHRGWGEAPENSLASIRLNHEKGYHAFETDIRFTKDNVPVLLHDTTINNVARNNDLTTISELTYIKDLTFEEVRTNYVFNVERENHSSPTELEGYENNRITSFEEMLDYVKENRMYVSIELKTGNREQIESLVKMTQDRDMHNYVRWISFSTNLLKFVKEYDDDEGLLVLKSSSCDEAKVYFCGEDVDYFLEKLKTDKNTVWISGSPIKTAPITIVNLPKSYEANLPQTGLKDHIPRGSLTLLETSNIMVIGNKSNISYQYDGDGEIKCISSNSTQLTCVVDANNHSIQLESVGQAESNVTVSVYATQGILYSATPDKTISVTIENETHNALRHLKDIKVDNYDMKFDPNKNTYKIKIDDEKELKIKVSFDTEDGLYRIDGNKDLKNGSVVSVHILNSRGDVLLTYNIEIEKEEQIINVPDTLKNPSTIISIIAIMIIVLGVGFILYSFTSPKKS